MSTLTWDGTGTRFYETGVSKGVLYPQKANGTYDTGVAWNGLTGVTESPQGAEPNDLYADNIKYATLRSAETLNLTIEAYTYPKEWGECDGSAAPADGLYVGQQARKPFGFCYRTEVGNDVVSYADDSGYKLHLIYNCTASPSDRSFETVNDSPDAQTLSWEVTTIPIPVTGYKPTASITIDTMKLTPELRAKVKDLEDVLYGTAGSDPSLPSPDEVIAMFTGSAGAVALTGLTIEGATLSPEFEDSNTVYTASISSETAAITATSIDGANISIMVNGSAVTNGSSVNFNEGNNAVTITVTKPGALATTYTVVVTRT